MKKSFLITAVCAVISMGLALPLGAQTNPSTAGSLASNTNVATAGIFRNDVDNFVDYHKYSSVLKDAKWFGFLTGRTTLGGSLDAGYARYFGGIYLGVWYRGNIFRSPAGVYETKTITPVYDLNDPALLTQKTDTTSYTAQWYESANNIEFLIGVAGMGIKVGFFESTATNKNDGAPGRDVTIADTLDGRKTYTSAIDEYSNSYSHLRPYIGWGGTFPVAGMTLRPYANINFYFFNSSLIDKYSNYTTANGVKQNIQTYVGQGRNSGFFNPYGNIGAWLDLAKKETVQQSVGLSYGFDVYLYNNDADALGSVDGTITWAAGYINRETKYTDRTETSTNITYTINEIKNVTHTITPSYKITGEPAENFKLGFSASAPIRIHSESSDNYTRQKQKDAVKYINGNPGYVRDRDTITYINNGNTETSIFGITLNLAAGASYQLIPGRFGINAGIAAQPIAYSQTVVKRLPRTTASIETDKTTQDDGSVTNNSKTVSLKTEPDNVTNNSSWAQYTATLSGGFTFNFNNNAALDLAANSGAYTANGFNLNLTTVNVIFTFKY